MRPRGLRWPAWQGPGDRSQLRAPRGKGCHLQCIDERPRRYQGSCQAMEMLTGQPAQLVAGRRANLEAVNDADGQHPSTEMPPVREGATSEPLGKPRQWRAFVLLPGVSTFPLVLPAKMPKVSAQRREYSYFSRDLSRRSGSITTAAGGDLDRRKLFPAFP